jgi:hypothetical protein
MENRELIEKYYDRSLSNEEKELFRAKYEGDPIFKGEVDLQARLLAALAVNEAAHSEPQKPRKVILNRKSVITATIACAALLVVGLIIPTLVNNRHSEAITPEPTLSLSNDTILPPSTETPLIETEADKPNESTAEVVETPESDANVHMAEVFEAPMVANSGAIASTSAIGEEGSDIKSLTIMFIDGGYWVLWQPLHGVADIEVCAVGEDGLTSEVSFLTEYDYDLLEGEYGLEGIDTSQQYELFIRREGLPDVTLPLSF